MKNIFFIASTLLVAVLITATVQKSSAQANMKGKVMKIKLIINNSEFTAAMNDNSSAKDFISLLPLTLKLEDYASTEKISNLPRKLSLKGAPPGIEPSVGDITYYSPWGNLALFYRDFRYAGGLVLLGHIDSSEKFFKACGNSCEVRLEKITPD